MIWGLLFLTVAGCSLRASAQPATCESDQQCQSGFHCVPNVFQCRRCLDCEDLKRDPPRAPTACIKSVLECGSCIKGFVENLHGDVTAECVAEAGGTAGGASLPAWAWVAVSMGLLLFVLVVVALLYVLRNTNTFKILASTRTSVRSPGVVASAPDAPPPYRAHYHHHDDNHRNNHNNHGGHDTDHYDTDTESYAARDRDHNDLLPDMVDPSAPSDGGLSPASPPGSPRAARKPRAPPPGPRESAARQATRFYNEPYYVRPPRYSDAGVASPPAPPPEPPALHDDDTMESTWTPAAHDDHGNAAGGGELAALLAAARLRDHCGQRHRHQHPHQHPHQHQHPPCTQDSNNNRSSGAAPSGPEPSGSAPLPQAPVSYIINVVQNMQNRT